MKILVFLVAILLCLPTYARFKIDCRDDNSGICYHLNIENQIASCEALSKMAVSLYVSGELYEKGTSTREYRFDRVEEIHEDETYRVFYGVGRFESQYHSDVLVSQSPTSCELFAIE